MYYNKRNILQTFIDYAANATDDAWEKLTQKLAGLVSNKRQGSFFKLFLTGGFGGSFHEGASSQYYMSRSSVR
jgi:hypothetical protein